MILFSLYGIRQFSVPNTPAIRRTGPWCLAFLERRLSSAGVNVLLDTNELSEPMRERPAGAGRAVIHELSYGIQLLADGRRKERFRSYLQSLLSSGLPVLPYDNAATQGAVTLRQLNHRCGPLTGATTAQILAGGKHLRRPL